MGTVYSGVVPNMVRFFPDRRGLASGILAAGVGTGALIWAPVAAMMIKKYSVLPTFKMLGVLYLVLLCVLSLLMKTAPAGFAPEGWNPSKEGQKNIDMPDKDWRGMLLDPLFYCLAAVYVAGGIAGLMIVAHASPILQTVGQYSVIAAGSWVGILAIFNSGGRAGWGFISDKIGRMPSILIIYTILGLAMLWLAFTPFAVVVPVLIVGSCFGGFMGMIASITADAFGPKYLPVNFGVMFLPFGVAAFIGPRLAAVIKAGSGNYSKAFLIAGILSFLGIAFAFLAQKLLQRRKEAVSGFGSMKLRQGTTQ
jgi:OFA family oxalate/formate antiporter-like MFS transporter